MIKKIFVYGLMLLAGANAHDYSVCAGVQDKLSVSAVTLSPDPPVPGQKLSVEIQATPTVAVTAGQATLAITAFGVKIATLNFDLCKDMGVTCPVAAGTPIKASVSYDIPSIVPHGVTASAQCDVKDGSGNELSCVKLDVKVGSAKSLRASQLGQKFPREYYEYLFEAWRMQFGKTFSDPAEFMHRFQIFRENTDRIALHDPQATFAQAHNEYSTLSWNEFRSLMGLGRPLPPRPFVTTSTFVYNSNTTLPTSVDWTTKGAVTPVKNQGQCGSCWAFSTTGSTEGAGFISTGQLISLSEQQLVDCSSAQGNQGCNGGLMDNAFNYIQSNGGLCSETAYPYTGTDGTCNAGSCSSQSNSKVTGHTDVAQNDNALMAAVAQQPVSVAIEADQMAFQFYSSGVLTGTCGTTLDHGVLAVGYGASSGTNYYKVKNSWGASWGMQGYVLIQRGKAQTGGQCGILMAASYPTVAAHSAQE